jgi:protein-disulfide isomerase
MRILLPAAISALLALPAASFDPANMTPAEREAFNAAVRATILSNPQIVAEALQLVEEQQQLASVEADKALVVANSTALFEDPASWVGGNPKGDITLIKFSDYRCGYCRKANEEVDELVRSDGNIRYILKEFPILGEESTLSAQFAVAALQLGGAETYDKAHDALISFRGAVTSAALRDLAVELGLDPDAVAARMASPEVASVIDANHALGQTMQISGTPTFVIGGQMVRGYLPLDVMRQVVAEEREG